MIRLGAFGAKARNAAARAIARTGVAPAHLTATGLVAAFASGFAYFKGSFRLAAAFLVLSGLCDALDGEVARASGRTSPFGAFLDSMLDRVSDAAVIGGIMLYYASSAADTYVTLALAALVGAFLTSYARARAESLIARCDVGLVERPERLALLIVASLIGQIPAALWILAIAGNFTAVQRIIHVKLALRKANAGARAPVDGEDR